MDKFLSIFIIALLWTIWSNNRLKKARKPKTFEGEYEQLVETHMRARANGEAIKSYLLEVLDDCANDREKFSDAAISKAEELYNEIGPGGYYWITEIAAQFILLSAAKFNDIPTSVDQALKSPVSPSQLVEEVVRVNY